MDHVVFVDLYIIVFSFFGFKFAFVGAIHESPANIA